MFYLNKLTELQRSWKVSPTVVATKNSRAKRQGKLRNRNERYMVAPCRKQKSYAKHTRQFKLLDNEDSEKLDSTIESLGKVLNGVTTEQLKESVVARKRVKDGIDDILGKFI